MRYSLFLLYLFFFVYLRPPFSPLFPYTTLFRSRSVSSRENRQLRSWPSAVIRTRSQLPQKGLVTERITPTVVGPSSTRKRSEEHTSELQSRGHLVCRLLLEKKNSKRK